MQPHVTWVQFWIGEKAAFQFDWRLCKRRDLLLCFTLSWGFGVTKDVLYLKLIPSPLSVLSDIARYDFRHDLTLAEGVAGTFKIEKVYPCDQWKCKWVKIVLLMTIKVTFKVFGSRDLLWNLLSPAVWFAKAKESVLHPTSKFSRHDCTYSAKMYMNINRIYLSQRLEIPTQCKVSSFVAT